MARSIPGDGAVKVTPRRARASATRPRERPRRLRPRNVLLALGLGGAGLLGAGGVAAYGYVAADLPSLDQLRSDRLAQTTRIYDRQGPVGGTVLEQVFRERRVVVPLSDVAPVLRQASISVEDRSFYQHQGINPMRIVSAAVYDLTHHDTAQGASTIDQQVIKLSVLGPQRSFSRKLSEAILSLELERRYSKDQILEYYLNTIYYGNAAFGIEAASQLYFRIHASELDLAQASFLAGLPQRPSDFDPFTHDGLQAARARQLEVLGAMLRDGRITASQADQAFAEDIGTPLAAAGRELRTKRHVEAPHFVDYVIQLLNEKYGARMVREGGLTVTTTLDLSLQRSADAIVKKDVTAIGHGANNAAFLAMDPHDGEIRAMVGSADYWSEGITGQENLTTALRQPGSSFKPYVYATALENGFTPESTLIDAGGNIGGQVYHDWDLREYGPISLRNSLALSRNISSVRLFLQVGMDRVFSLVRGLGLKSNLKHEGGTAIGSSEVRMVQHLAGYSAFANGGNRVAPVAILRVTDAQGRVLQDFAQVPSTRRAMPAMVAYQITDILKGAVNRSWGLDFPVAGKSGTTNNFVDAWYVGYTTDLAFATWVGHTEPGKWLVGMDGVYGETGAGVVWKDFAKAYYSSHPRPSDWVRPRESVPVLVCADGRRATRAVEGSTSWKFFQPDRVPHAYCDQPTLPESTESPTPWWAQPSPTPSPAPIATPQPSPSIYIEPSPSPSPPNPVVSIPVGH